MTRVSTLFDQHGRPEDRVQIIRQGKNTTQIRRAANHGRSWTDEDEQVDFEEILDVDQDAAPTDKVASVREPQASAESASASVVGQQVSYIRVSSIDQNLARQREMIGPIDREFVDKISARSRDNRPGLDDCIAYLRHGDALQVASIDRLARSLMDLRGIIDQITAKGASVHFVKEHLTFSAKSTDPRATLMLGVLGSFAEFERSITRERQAEGIALAKKAGKYKGRKRALTSGQVQEAHQRAAHGESKVAIAKELGVSRATLYRALSSKSSD